MHFQVAATDINYGMNMVCRALSAHPSLHVYDGVFVDASQDVVTLTCTDGEISIKARVPAMVKEEGCALIPAKLMSELLRTMEEQVDLAVDQKSRAVLRSQGSNTDMSCLPADDFPDIPDVTGDFVTELPQKQLRDALSRIAFAISSDETRKILTGCLMETYGQETRFVGLDGFRLALQRVYSSHDMPKGVEQQDAIIPGKTVGEISRMLGDTEDKAAIACSKTHMMLTFGNVKVFSTLLAGEYINYKQILPTSWQTEIKICREDFMGSIERTSLIAREGKSNLIKVHLEEDTMTISANAECGAALEKIPISFSGNVLDIAFNAKYLADVIRNAEAEELCMRFNSNVSPCVITPVEGNRFTYLVLPIRMFGVN
jgi:DNA polymerase III subunit beta